PALERSKHLEGVAQLLERGAQQLDVAAVGAVAHQLVGSFLELLHQLLDADARSIVGMWFIVNMLKRGAAIAATVCFHARSLFRLILCWARRCLIRILAAYYTRVPQKLIFYAREGPGTRRVRHKGCVHCLEHSPGRASSLGAKFIVGR